MTTPSTTTIPASWVTLTDGPTGALLTNRRGRR